MTAQVKVVYSSHSGADGFKVGTIFTDLDDKATELITAFIAG